MRKMRNMHEREIRKLAAEAMVDVRTVRRFMAREAIRPASETRIRDAAKKLRLKIRKTT